MEINEPASKTLTHFDKQGNALMVDVSQKADTVREAVACGMIQVNEAVYQAVEAGTVKKGDVLAVAASAGIMGGGKEDVGANSDVPYSAADGLPGLV